MIYIANVDTMCLMDTPGNRLRHLRTKVLVSDYHKSGGKLIVKQLNPPKELAWDAHDVVSVHKIVGVAHEAICAIQKILTSRDMFRIVSPPANRGWPTRGESNVRYQYRP